MAGLAFGGCDVQHVLEIEDIGIKMHAIHKVCNGARKVRQIGIADVILDLDIIQRKRADLCIDALCGAVFIPSTRTHVSTFLNQ